MRRLYILFLQYFIDHSAVKYLLLNILVINIGSFFPKNSQNVGKIFLYLKYNCNKVAIIGENNTPIYKRLG